MKQNTYTKNHTVSPHSSDLTTQILTLQQTGGNQMVTQMIKASTQKQKPVIQRATDDEGKEIHIPWDLLEENPQLLKDLTAKVKTGEYILSESEMERLDDLLDEDYVPGFTPDQEELIDSMKPGLEEKVRERKRKFPGRKVQGDMLEQNASVFLNDTGVSELNTNNFLMNCPGIDHIQDSPTFPFVQDKMHLAESSANYKTYRTHYAKRKTMAKKLIGTMSGETKDSEAIKKMYKTVIENPDWSNSKDFLQSILDKVDEHKKAYQKMLDGETEIEVGNLIDDEDLVKEIASKIGFSVPSDIYEQLYSIYSAGQKDNKKETISPEEMSSFIRLDMSTLEFMEVFKEFDEYASPYNEKKPKEEEEEFKLSVEEDEEDPQPTKKKQKK